MEEVNDVVKNDWTVEVDLLSTTKAPVKTNIGKQIVQVSKWRKKEKGVLLTNTNLLVYCSLNGLHSSLCINLEYAG